MRCPAVADLDRLTREHGPDASRDSRPRWAGVEHEFKVLVGADQLDFRSLVGTTGAGIGGLDPGDPRARRLDTGAVVTADGREAEIATPPAVVAPGFTHRLLRGAQNARVQLRGVVGDAELEGYSTHLSVEVADRRAVKVARRFTESFAVPMMLLLDGADSPGLLVRPRRNRVELAGEYVTGESLRTAAAFAATAVIALDARMPRHLRVGGSFDPARERYGWYVDRSAYGPDLYRLGRSTRLPGGVTAQDQLMRCWHWSRPAAEALLDVDELRLVDEVVDGVRPIPLEAGCAEVDESSERHATDQEPFASVLVPRRRNGVEVRAAVVTWAFAVLDVSDGDSVVHLNIPGRRLKRFLQALDRGELDPVLRGLLVSADRLPVLTASTQTDEVGAYRAVRSPSDLVSSERDLLTGRVGGPSGPESRRDKERDHGDRPRPMPKAPRKLVLAGIAVAALVLLGAVVAVAMSRSGETGVVADGDPSAMTEPESTTSTEAAGASSRRPLENDPCTMLSDDAVRAYAEVMVGDYPDPDRVLQVVPDPDGQSADPRFERQCEWQFVDPSGLSSPNEVGVKLKRLDLDDPFLEGVDQCSMFSTGGGIQDLAGIGDIAQATDGYGFFCIGDLRVDISYGGISSDLPGPPPEFRLLFEQAAAALAGEPLPAPTPSPTTAAPPPPSAPSTPSNPPTSEPSVAERAPRAPTGAGGV